MEKLTELTVKESSGEQALNGTYRIVADVKVNSTQKLTIEDLNKQLVSLGASDYRIEKHCDNTSIVFNTGDTVELVEDFNSLIPVYVDTSGNFVVTDNPVKQCVDKVGEYYICVPRGTVAEINKTASGDSAQVLFSGEMVEVDINGLARNAYLGIINLPCPSLSRYE